MVETDPNQAAAATVDESASESGGMTEEQVLEAFFAQGMAFCAAWVTSGALMNEDNQKALAGFLTSEMADQPSVQAVFESMIDPEKMKSHPWIGVWAEATDEFGGKKKICHTRIPKALFPNMPLTPPLIIHLGFLVGMITYPPLRALMRAYGYEVNFEQAKQPLPQPAAAPKLVVPS